MRIPSGRSSQRPRIFCGACTGYGRAFKFFGAIRKIFMRFSILLFCGALDRLGGRRGARTADPTYEYFRETHDAAADRNGPYSTALTPKTTSTLCRWTTILAYRTLARMAIASGRLPGVLFRSWLCFWAWIRRRKSCDDAISARVAIGLKFADGFKQWNGAVFVDAGVAH